MPETRPPIRTTENEDTPHPKDASEAERHRRGRGGRQRFTKRRALDPRASDVGLDSRATETRGRGVGYADEIRSPDTEHKTGRTDDGAGTTS